jgi:hypothetical protein
VSRIVVDVLSFVVITSVSFEVAVVGVVVVVEVSLINGVLKVVVKVSVMSVLLVDVVFDLIVAVVEV